MYFIIAGIIFFVAFAMMVQEKLWNNLITLVAILVGGILSFGLYQPVTIFVDEQTSGKFTYLLDFLVIWILFIVAVGLLKALAGALSKKRVIFQESLDPAGGALVAAFTAYLMTGFVMASLHAAPLAHDSFGGKFVMGESREEVASTIASTSVLTRPDLAWLLLMENTLQGSALGGSNFSPSRYVHGLAEHRRVFGTIQSTLVKRR